MGKKILKGQKALQQKLNSLEGRWGRSEFKEFRVICSFQGEMFLSKVRIDRVITIGSYSIRQFLTNQKELSNTNCAFDS